MTNKVPLVLIVGGGFGGLAAAKALRRAPVNVLLIDRSNHHVFQPLLYQVATSVLAPGQIASPLRGLLADQEKTSVMLGNVTGIDPATRHVIVDAGDKKGLRVTSLQVGHGLACLTLLLSLCAGSIGQTQSEAQSPVPGSAIHVTHVLGFEGARHNATGDLKIQGDAVQFQRDGSPTAQVNISSIQDIFVEDEDKQVGGTAMTLGKTAAPFGGGRVVSLFAHKKYDFLTVEYVDSNDGVHGAVFQLNKGQGEVLGNELLARGAHVSRSADEPTKQSTGEVTSESK